MRRGQSNLHPANKDEFGKRTKCIFKKLQEQPEFSQTTERDHHTPLTKTYLIYFSRAVAIVLILEMVWAEHYFGYFTIALSSEHIGHNETNSDNWVLGRFAALRVASLNICSSLFFRVFFSFWQKKKWTCWRYPCVPNLFKLHTLFVNFHTTLTMIFVDRKKRLFVTARNTSQMVQTWEEMAPSLMRWLIPLSDIVVQNVCHICWLFLSVITV